MTHPESHIQKESVKWFRYQYSRYQKLLFAIPNGGFRTGAEATILKAEGVVPGVADLFLSIPRMHYPGMYIEMKAGCRCPHGYVGCKCRKGKMSPDQVAFKEAVEQMGYKHIVCDSLDVFMKEVNLYLS